MTDHTDLCKRLRKEHKLQYVEFEEAADAIEALEADNAALRRRLTVITEVLVDIQFSMQGYCPSCGGWDSDPKDPKRGDSPGFHTKTCPIAKAIAAMREGKEGK